MLQVVTKNSFTHQAVTWEQFQDLRSAFTEIGGARLVYCEGVLEIMSVGLWHEMICTLLGGLLLTYFSIKRISFISTGTYTQIVEGKTEFQADLSYAFGTVGSTKNLGGDRRDQKLDLRADLFIEIVVTSGNAKKLRKYELREVPEVWFWEDGKIAVYSLQDRGYELICKSLCLPELDLAHLERCLMMESQLVAMLSFRERYEF
jgi:Uma2 family endonuclease